MIVDQKSIWIVILDTISSNFLIRYNILEILKLKINCYNCKCVFFLREGYNILP